MVEPNDEQAAQNSSIELKQSNYTVDGMETAMLQRMSTRGPTLPGRDSRSLIRRTCGEWARYKN